MCDPILVILLKMRPHDSQSSRENETTSSGSSLLASYYEDPPPPPRASIVLIFIPVKIMDMMITMKVSFSECK